MMVAGGAIVMGLVIFLLVLGVLAAVAVVAYNRLVGLTQRSGEAWSDVDVQLKRRTDLVPNLVETVRGYAAHERGTLDAVVRARGAAAGAQTPEARARAEGQLTDALRQLFALAEAYPDLKASQSFQSLQQSLAQIEDDIQSSRRYYNAVVRDLNTAVDSFPSNLVASFFRFVKRAYFELDRPDDRQVPRVTFGS
jgi:LemA protein